MRVVCITGKALLFFRIGRPVLRSKLLAQFTILAPPGLKNNRASPALLVKKTEKTFQTQIRN
jgi:hypothetical protein